MSWASNSKKNNQYVYQSPQPSYQQADKEFENNINTPMMNKYQGSSNKGSDKKQRMAGDYLREFTNQFSDNSKVKEVTSKDYRGDTRNQSVASFLGNSAPNSTVKQLQGSDSTSKSENIVPNANESGKDTTAKKPANTTQPGYMSNEIYQQNLKIIENYDGKNGATSNAAGAQYNADLMSGVNYDRAVRQNEKMKAGHESQASIAAGNDHGSGDWKAPQSKEYYDYLKTYDGPTSYKAVVAANDSPAVQMGLDKSKPRAYDTWEKWVKDSRHYKKAWEGIDYKKVDDSAAYGLP